MSINGREQQELDSIRMRLGEADPHLAELLEAFGRLAADEEMPACEQLVPPARHIPAWHRTASTGTLVVLWLLALVIFLGVAIGVAMNDSRGPAPCGAYRGVGCTTPASPHPADPPSRSASSRAYRPG